MNLEEDIPPNHLVRVVNVESWTYDEAEDRWICPAGQMLQFRRESKEILESGYVIRKRH